MVLAHIDHPESYRPLLVLPAWRVVTTWLRNAPKDLSEGEYVIQGKDIFFNCHKATTVPRGQGVYEAHTKYVDVHYCLAGGEKIEWALANMLQPRTEYDAAKDVTLFASPSQASSCVMTLGTFAIFFPDEAHMPKINDGQHAMVRKVVVKIKRELLRI